MNTTAALIIIFAGLIGSSYYSGLETGIFSINRLRLRHLVRKKVPGAAILDDFLKRPEYLLGTTLVGNNLCNTITSVTALSLGTFLAGSIGNALAYVIITLIMLISGEYLPKAWFQGKPAARTLPFMKSLKVNGILFYPITLVTTWLARILVPLPRNQGEQAKP
ncbi:MAG: DUF21 domain-containing protein, partial [Verrucomicrobiota bacterium]